MSPGDKATLRLAIGLGLAVLVAYGLALAVPFVVCVMSVVVLSRPGPPVPLVKGLVVALLLAVLVAVGIAMVPLLEHYAFAGVLLTAVVLHAALLQRAGRRQPAQQRAGPVVRADPGRRRRRAGPGRRAERRARDRRRHRRAGERGLPRPVPGPAGTCRRDRRQGAAGAGGGRVDRPSGHADRDAGLRPRADRSVVLPGGGDEDGRARTAGRRDRCPLGRRRAGRRDAGRSRHRSGSLDRPVDLARASGC